MKNKDYSQGFRDGIERAITLAKSMGISDDYIKRLEAEITENDGFLKLKFGESYLILEESNRMGKQIIRQIENRNIPLIILTREINFKGQLNATKVFYVTYENTENSVNPIDLSRMDSIVRNNFKEKGVVYLESVDYIYNQNQERIQPLVKLISSLKDFIYKNNGIFIITADPRVFREQDLLQIKKEFSQVLDFINK